MIRGTSIVLGVGLIILWLVGLSNHATAWLTWLDGLAGLCAFGIAAAVPANLDTRRAIGGPIGLAVALFVLWIIGLAVGAQGWLSWWTFAFAVAFLVLGFASTSTRMTHTRSPRLA